MTASTAQSFENLPSSVTETYTEVGGSVPRFSRSAAPTCFASLRVLLGRKAIEQAVAAGSDQTRLGAVAGHVGRIPRRVVRRAVDVSEFGRAEGAAGPVVARQIYVRREGAALGGRAGERVVPVRRHAEAGDHLAALRSEERRVGKECRY